jgi:hypothetical protein
VEADAIETRGQWRVGTWKNRDVKSNKPAVTKPATVKKILESPHPETPERAEISIMVVTPFYQELRIENKLTDEKGNEVK